MSHGWLEIVVRAGAADVARVERALEGCGALAVTCRAGSEEPLFGDLAITSNRLWRVCEVVGLFDRGVDRQGVERAVAEAARGTVEIANSELADRPWTRVWMDRFRPLDFGHGLWVCPSGFEPPEPAATVVRLDPGMAFGTGTHETTALCLEWIAGHGALGGASVLDFGCGSGILAIAAAKRGAGRVVAVDIDPAARAVARANARANACGSIEVIDPDTLAPAEFDIVIANILARPLIELAPQFEQHLRPGGTVVLSGILVQETAAVLAAYSARFTMDPPVCRGEWARLTGGRRATRVC